LTVSGYVEFADKKINVVQLNNLNQCGLYLLTDSFEIGISIIGKKVHDKSIVSNPRKTSIAIQVLTL